MPVPVLKLQSSSSVLASWAEKVPSGSPMNTRFPAVASAPLRFGYVEPVIGLDLAGDRIDRLEGAVEAVRILVLPPANRSRGFTGAALVHHVLLLSVKMKLQPS